MGLGESALILLGVGIISQKFGAGLGLEQLGVGVKTLAAAPLGGVGLGLGEFAGGLRGFAESLGDIGRGFGALFENIPQYQGPVPGIPGNGNGQQLESMPILRLAAPAQVVKTGGGSSDQLAGGGGSTPRPPIDLGPAGPRPPPTTPYYLTRSTQMTDDRARNVMML